MAGDATFEQARIQMVESQVRLRGITEERVIAAFRKIPRHLFVPEEFRHEAYADHPLPIGAGQTISQPYIVALMTQALRLQGHERVLEIGAGSGYQTAILAELALEVFAIERIPDLLEGVRHRLRASGCLNVQLATGNGSLGWPEHAPYDGILVSAAAPDIPRPLLAQLAEGGRMVLPIGPHPSQMLVEVEKRGGRIIHKELASCVFVPLVGEHGWSTEALG